MLVVGIWEYHQPSSLLFGIDMNSNYFFNIFFLALTIWKFESPNALQLWNNTHKNPSPGKQISFDITFYFVFKIKTCSDSKKQICNHLTPNSIQLYYERRYKWKYAKKSIEVLKNAFVIFIIKKKKTTNLLY